MVSDCNIMNDSHIVKNSINPQVQVCLQPDSDVNTNKFNSRLLSSVCLIKFKGLLVQLWSLHVCDCLWYLDLNSCNQTVETCFGNAWPQAITRSKLSLPLSTPTSRELASRLGNAYSVWKGGVLIPHSCSDLFHENPLSCTLVIAIPNPIFLSRKIH